MAVVNPYLNFNGNCEEAFNHYKKVFGTEFQFAGRFKDMPPMEGQPPIPEADVEKIMHISLPISKETVLMGSDCLDVFGKATFGTNFTISVNTDSKAEAERIFNGLAEGGKVTMPMSQTFWSSYFGMLVDRFDIPWMVSFEQGKQ
jgi:PhnB protein